MDPRLLPDLLVFLEVSRAGSITGAAARLHTVQSNVTARIKKLETALGTPLLKRQARGIKLSPSGEAALHIALRLDAALNDLRFTFGQSQTSRRAKLRLGAIETVAASRLPAWVASFTTTYAHVDISVRTGSSSSLIEQVKDATIEAAFASRAPRLPGFRSVPAFTDELVVVAPPGLRSLAALVQPRDRPFDVIVQRPGCSYTERLLNWLEERNRRPSRLIEMGTLEGIIGLVQAGLGVAAMPRAFVDSVAPARAVSRLALPPGIRRLDTFLVTLSAEESSTLVNEFVEFCRARPDK
jgi:DNA-binding transcriptional LysR family regulator